LKILENFEWPKTMFRLLIYSKISTIQLPPFPFFQDPLFLNLFAPLLDIFSFAYPLPVRLLSFSLFIVPFSPFHPQFIPCFQFFCVVLAYSANSSSFLFCYSLRIYIFFSFWLPPPPHLLLFIQLPINDILSDPLCSLPYPLFTSVPYISFYPPS
jgi:hypothetical protein